MQFQILLTALALINVCAASPAGTLLHRATENCACEDDESQVDQVWWFYQNDVYYAAEHVIEDMQAEDYHLLEGDAAALTAAHQRVMDYVNSLDCVNSRTVHTLNLIASSITTNFAPIYHNPEPPLRKEVFNLAKTALEIGAEINNWINDEWSANPDCAECLVSNRYHWLSPNGDVSWLNCYANYYGLGVTISAESLCEPKELDCTLPPYTPEPSTTAPEPSTTAPEPSTTAPDSSTTAPEPSTTAPEPSTTAPEPSTTAPQPSTTAPEPISATPEPSSIVSEPSLTAPQPSSTAPEPSSVNTELRPKSPESSSTAPELSLTALQPSPVAPEPSSVAAELSSTTSGLSSVIPGHSSAAPKPTSATPEPNSAASVSSSAASGSSSVLPARSTASESSLILSFSWVTPGPSSGVAEPSSAVPSQSATESAVSRAESTIGSISSSSAPESIRVTSGVSVDLDSKIVSDQTQSTEQTRASTVTGIATGTDLFQTTVSDEEDPVPSTVTVVTEFTTYCPEPTTYCPGNGHCYTVTKPTTLTISDCPCTLTAGEGVGNTPETVSPAQSAPVSMSPGQAAPIIPANNGYRTNPFWIGAVALIVVLM